MTSIWACLSSVVRKMTAYPYCAGLARSPFVLTEHIFSYIYIYMVRDTHFSSAVPGYVMWEELSVSHF